jgi:hypothetical protein
LLNVELLEKLSETYLDALSTGREVIPIPASISNLLVEVRKKAQDKIAAKNKEQLEAQ